MNSGITSSINRSSDINSNEIILLRMHRFSPGHHSWNKSVTPQQNTTRTACHQGAIIFNHRFLNYEVDNFPHFVFNMTNAASCLKPTIWLSSSVSQKVLYFFILLDTGINLFNNISHDSMHRRVLPALLYLVLFRSSCIVYSLILHPPHRMLGGHDGFTREKIRRCLRAESHSLINGIVIDVILVSKLMPPNSLALCSAHWCLLPIA